MLAAFAAMPHITSAFYTRMRAITRHTRRHDAAPLYACFRFIATATFSLMPDT